MHNALTLARPGAGGVRQVSDSPRGNCRLVYGPRGGSDNARKERYPWTIKRWLR